MQDSKSCNGDLDTNSPTPLEHLFQHCCRRMNEQRALIRGSSRSPGLGLTLAVLGGNKLPMRQTGEPFQEPRPGQQPLVDKFLAIYHCDISIPSTDLQKFSIPSWQSQKMCLEKATSSQSSFVTFQASWGPTANCTPGAKDPVPSVSATPHPLGTSATIPPCPPASGPCFHPGSRIQNKLVAAPAPWVLAPPSFEAGPARDRPPRTRACPLHMVPCGVFGTCLRLLSASLAVWSRPLYHGESASRCVLVELSSVPIAMVFL
jgi:hypothetical protein